jgi:hypothetical protein
MMGNGDHTAAYGHTPRKKAPRDGRWMLVSWWMLVDEGTGEGDNSASLFVVSAITCSGNLFGSSRGVSDPPFFKALPVAFVRKVNKHHFTFPNFPLRPKLQFMDFNHHCLRRLFSLALLRF